MVYDLDSTHKKPYEPLLIGRFDERIKPCERRTIDKTGPEEFNNRTDEMTIYPGLEGKNQGKVKVSLENVRETKDKGQQSDFERILPQHQIICSVPCSFHSRKPPLNGKTCQICRQEFLIGFSAEEVLYQFSSSS